MKLTILGKPKQKQGFMFTMTGHRYKKKDVAEAEQNIRTQVINQIPKDFKLWDCPIEVKSILYVFPILTSFPKWKRDLIKSGTIIHKSTKPDLTDNLQKGLFDALEGIIYVNDSLICKIGSLDKIYGDKPRTEVIIEPFIGLTDKSKK